MNQLKSAAKDRSAFSNPAKLVRAEAARPDWRKHFLDADKPSLLLFSSTDWEGIDTQAFAALAGFRILGWSSFVEAERRLSLIVDLDAALVICNGDEPGLEHLLKQLDHMALKSRLQLSVITAMDGLDLVHAAIEAPSATILCEPRPAEISVTLTSMAQQARPFERLSDVGRDSIDISIEKLSEDLNRLRQTIEVLVQDRLPQHTPIADFPSPPGEEESALHSPRRDFGGFSAPEMQDKVIVSAQQVRAVLRLRRLRDQIVSADLFADPAWDILLDLMAAHLEGVRVSVSSLCIAASVPPTTALRWIRQLTEKGLLQRNADPSDGRRIFIALSPEGVDAVNRWFAASRLHLLSAAG
jgi:DNA-binding MarR family transcriptional regulator